MKCFLQFLALILFVNACSSGQNKAANPSVPDSNKVSNSIKTTELNFSFVGKRSTVIDSLKWFNCGGTVAISPEGEAIEYMIARVASSRENCDTNDVRFLLEKLLYRTEYGKPVSLILDELIIKSYPEDSYYTPVTCKQKETGINETLLVHYKNEGEKLRIAEMWRIDRYKELLIKVASPEMYECLEEEGCIEEERI